MVAEGLELIGNIRRRYNGERRNPWNEAECGYHYARPMASWAALLALSGFRYDGVEKRVEIKPRVDAGNFNSFWSSAGGWGSFSHRMGRSSVEVELKVVKGDLVVRSAALSPTGKGTRSPMAKLGTQVFTPLVNRNQKETLLQFPEEITVRAGDNLLLLA
jgi:non-lysosomal glucosylceramidase